MLSVLMMLLPMITPLEAIAASSWSPALLVNTESFQVIDDDDTTANIVLKFGDTLNKSLTYDRTAERFSFDDDLYVEGDVDVSGTASGRALHAQDALSSSGLLVVTADGESASSDTEGYNSPSTVISDDSIGTGTWTDPEEAEEAGGSKAVSPSDYADTEYSAKLVVAGSVAGTDKSTGAIPPNPEAYVSYGGVSDLWGLSLSPSVINASNFGFAIAFEGSNGITEYLFATEFGFSIPADATIDGVLVEVEQEWNAGDLAVSIDHIRMMVHYTTTSSTKHVITASGGKLGVRTPAPETELEVVGTASGRVIHGQDAIHSSGSLTWEGAASGSSLYLGQKLEGAGLSDCDTGASSKLLWDATTGRFSCGTDQTGGGSAGLVNHYVNAGGDTMTGALRIDVTGGNLGTLGLRVANTASGAHVHAEKSLTSSGTFVAEGNLTFGDAIGDALSINAGTWTFSNDTNFVLSGGVNALSFDTLTFSVDAENNRIGIGTTIPGTELEVIGTISGAALHVNDLIDSKDAGTGSILVSRENNAPEWKEPTSSMVWYLDGTLSVGAMKSAVVTMPFGFTATSAKLRAIGAPTGADLIINILKNGVTLFSSKPQIDGGSTSGGDTAAFSVTDLGVDSEISINVDQVGSTFAGSGLTIQLNGIRKY